MTCDFCNQSLPHILQATPTLVIIVARHIEAYGVRKGRHYSVWGIRMGHCSVIRHTLGLRSRYKSTAYFILNTSSITLCDVCTHVNNGNCIERAYSRVWIFTPTVSSIGVGRTTRKALGERRPPPNENFKVIKNPGFLPDYPQNWITCGFCHFRHSLKISERSFHNFLSYLANTQTDKQTLAKT